MFARAAVGGLNHVLGNTPWATARLQPFAGRTARLTAPPFNLALVVTDDGRLAVGVTTGEPDVTIQLPDNAPLLWLTDRQALFGQARLAGTADFAEALAFVFRNLQWDIESDLAGLVGDVAAHRLVATGRRLTGWQERALKNVAANVGEYLLEEQASVARKDEVGGYCSEVDQLQEDIARLQKRLERLTK